jgi:membrane-bound metal-dependent hydrolase YbcI (DUF457 family)
MSTFVIHLLIPPLTALAARYFPQRYVWAWVWVSVIPDVDYVGWILYVNDILPFNFHRALFHNLFVLLVLLFFATRAWVRYRLNTPIARLSGYLQTRHGAGWVLSSYYYFSHLLLDSFQGGVVPFWPIWNLNVANFFFIQVDTQTQQVSTVAGSETSDGAPDVSALYPWLDSEQFAYCLLILASLTFAWLVFRRERAVEIIAAQTVGPELPTRSQAQK